jgi:hypothetical protein
MSKNIGTLISAAIRPNDSLDPIASAFASEIKGGLHTASNSTDRDSIIIERRDWGMLCYVTEQDITYQLRYNYVDTNIMNNSNWVEFIGGGSGNEWIDSVLSISLQTPSTYSVGDRYLAGINTNQSLLGDWSIFDPSVVLEWNSVNWIPTYPTDGMSVRVDNDDNSIYRYEGDFPDGEWFRENLSQVRAIDITTTNGVLFITDTEAKFDGYIRDMIFLSKFVSTNTGNTASLNINNLGDITIKKPSINGLVDLVPGEIIPGLVYSLVYDGLYFQLIKHYSSGDSGGLSIKYYIEPNEYVSVPPYHQYWVYGDLTIDGTLVNYGEVVIANGSIIVNTGTFSNNGTLKLVTLAQGFLSGSSSVYFNDSNTIEIDEQQTITGLSITANVRENSLLPNNLNTSLYGGATAGYVLSNNNGYFEWVQQSAKLTVIDGTPGTGLTISDVSNMVFIGGSVKVPTTGGSDNSLGVQVLPGGQTYPSNTALVYIPKAPDPIYASYLNSDNRPASNTDGTVNRLLSISNVRISSPISQGNPYSVGDWDITPPSFSFPSTNMDIVTFSTAEQITGFSATSSDDSTIKIDLLDGDDTTVLYTYTTPVIYQDSIFATNSGVNNLLIVNITEYSIDDSQFSEIYGVKFKAKLTIVLNSNNILSLVGRDGGRYRIKITHNLDSNTNYNNDPNPEYISSPVFLDTNPNTPSIISTSISETNPSNIITRFISGVQYYTTGSEFTIISNNIENLNRNTQGFNSGINYNFRLKSSGFGLPGGGPAGSTLPNGNLNIRSWSPIVGSFDNWNNNFNLGTVSFSRNDWSIEDSLTYRYRGTEARVESQVYDPWDESTVNLSLPQNILVDCNQMSSSDLVENFNLENKRLIRGTFSYLQWNSQSLLSTTTTATNGLLGNPNIPYVDAVFVSGNLRSPSRYFLSNGDIQSNLSSFKPNKGINNPNYSNLTGTPVFHRSFLTTNTSAIISFSMILTGNFGSPNNLLDALINSRLKIYIRKINAAETSHQFGHSSNPLSLHGMEYNFADFNDGIGTVDSVTGFIRTGVSGNIVYGTFGGFDALDGIWVEVQLVDITISLTGISVIFNQ